MMFLKRAAARVVACVVVAVLLVTAQTGHQAQAQAQAQDAAGVPAVVPAYSIPTPAPASSADECANPYVWVYDGWGKNEEYSLLTGEPTGRVEGSPARSLIVAEDGERAVIFKGVGSINVVDLNDPGFKAEFLLHNDVHEAVTDSHGLVSVLGREGDDLKLFSVLGYQQQISAVNNGDSGVIDVHEIAVVAHDVDFWHAGLASMPEGLATLIRDAADVNAPARLGFIPYFSSMFDNDSYGLLQDLGVLEFEGVPWSFDSIDATRGNARLFYKFGIVFLVDAVGTLYRLDEVALREYMENPDPARRIEVRKHDVQLNFSRQLRPYMEEWIASQPADRQEQERQQLVDAVQKGGRFIGAPVAACEHESFFFDLRGIDRQSSFQQDVDDTGAPIPDRFTAQISMLFEDKLRVLPGVRPAFADVVRYVPVFDESVFRVDDVYWCWGFCNYHIGTGILSRSHAFRGTGSVASGTEIRITHNPSYNHVHAVTLTVKYRRIAEDPKCDLFMHGVDIVPHDCLSNTVFIPGKSLSRFGRSVIEIPGIPDPAQPVLPPAVPPASAPGGNQLDPSQQPDPVNPANPTDPGAKPAPGQHGNPADPGALVDPVLPAPANPVPGGVNPGVPVPVPGGRPALVDPSLVPAPVDPGVQPYPGQQGNQVDPNQQPDPVDPGVQPGVNPGGQVDPADPADPAQQPDPAGQQGQGGQDANTGDQNQGAGQGGQVGRDNAQGDAAGAHGGAGRPVPISPADSVENAGQVGAVGQVADAKPVGAKTGAGVGLAETGAVAPAGGLLGVGVVVLLGAGILLTVAGRRHGRAV